MDVDVDYSAIDYSAIDYSAIDYSAIDYSPADYSMLCRNAAAVAAEAHQRLRTGSWTPTRAEQVMASNILAAIRPEHGPVFGAGFPARIRLARWAALIRLAHSIDPGPEPHACSTATLSGVLAAAYPLAWHLEALLPHPTRHTTGTADTESTPGIGVLAEVDAVLETGADCILELLDQLAAPLRGDTGRPSPTRHRTFPSPIDLDTGKAGDAVTELILQG